MTIYIVNQLRRLTDRWRQTAEVSRMATDTSKDLKLQGHLQGVSDGLLIAANDVDKILGEPNGDTPV